MPNDSARKLRFTLESTPYAAFEARRELSKVSGWLSGPTYLDLRLVVSELVANSVEHGQGRAISVSVELSQSGAVRGSVRDGGDGPVEVREYAEPGTGLGLQIVATLAARWAISPGSSDVWFELSAPELDGPQAPPGRGHSREQEESKRVRKSCPEAPGIGDPADSEHHPWGSD